MKISFLFLFLGLWIPAIGQNQEVDAFKKELALAKEDTLKLKLLSDLNWATAYTSRSAARTYANQELALALKISNKKWEAQAYNDLGIVEQLDMHLRPALELHQKALKIRTELGDVAGMGSSQLKIGMMFVELNDPDKALDACFQALIHLRKAGNKQGIAYALNNICTILEEQKQYKNISAYANESYTLCKELGDAVGMMNAANQLASMFEHEGNTPQSDLKYKEGLQLAISVGDTLKTATFLNNLGHLHRNEKSKKALQYYETALNMARQCSVQDTNGLILYSANTANQYNVFKNFGKAESLLRQALFLAQKGKLPTYLHQIYSTLGDIFTQTGQADSAVKYYTAFQLETQKKFSDEMAANFSRLQTQFEIDLREQQKATLSNEIELKAQKLLRYQFLIASLLVIIALVIWVFTLVRNRQKLVQKRQLDQERWQQQEARSKAVIEAEERERQRIARELHDGVGQQLSAARLHLSALEGTFNPSQVKEETLLVNAISMMDDAVKEVRAVAHTMLANALLKQGLAGAVRDFIQKINSGGLLKIELEISGLDQKLDGTVESMLFRIIQEIMSNVIRHSQANQVSIQLHRHETEVVLMVEDNGVGFDVSSTPGGVGLENMKSRVAYINGTFEVDSSPGRGTTISVEVKL